MNKEIFTKEYYNTRTTNEFRNYSTIYTLDDIFCLEDLIKYKFGTGAGFGMFYRGEGDCTWDITSNINRNLAENISGFEVQKAEERLLNTFLGKLFLKNSIDILLNRLDTGNPNLDNWYKLTQAQHGRLKTTLIDFTNSIRLACYFAVEDIEHDEQDGQVWLLVDFKRKLITYDSEIMRYNPFNLEDDLLIAPSIISDEILKKLFHHNNSMQHGLFVKQKSINCHLPLIHNKDFSECLYRFIIPASEKAKLRKELHSYFPKGVYNEADKTITNAVEECNNLLPKLIKS